jgi:hypothetical protein
MLIVRAVNRISQFAQTDLCFAPSQRKADASARITHEIVIVALQKELLPEMHAEKVDPPFVNDERLSITGNPGPAGRKDLDNHTFVGFADRIHSAEEAIPFACGFDLEYGTISPETVQRIGTVCCVRADHFQVFPSKIVVEQQSAFVEDRYPHLDITLSSGKKRECVI